MTKAELLKELKEKAGMATLTQAEAAYNGLVAILTATLQKGDSLTVHGFGAFKPVARAARKGRNPQTGKEIAIKASRSVKFTPAKALKESLQ